MRSLAVVLLVVGGVGCGSPPAPPPYRPVADVKTMMTTIMEPAAEVYWDAVGTIIDETGVHDFEPRTIEEWEAVRNAAYALAETGNLLIMPGRAKDSGEWTQLSVGLMTSAQEAIRAAEARDTSAVFDAGAELYYACTNCHAKYSPEILRPNSSQ